MTAGKIERVIRERVERREDARLPAVWVLDGTAARTAVSGTTWLQRTEDSASTEVTPDGPALVMLAGPASAAIRALLARASGGERVYVLSSATWDPLANDPRLTACPRVLLRRVPQIPVSAVVTARGGRVWFGGSAGDVETWTLQLDDEQTAALKWLFLRMFWHLAVDETWTGDDRRPPFRPARKRPFEIAEPPSTAPIRLTPATANLDLELQDAVVHSRSGAVPGRGTMRRLWVSPGDRHHEVLAQLVRDGVEVHWTERGLPDAVIGFDRGSLLLASPGERLLITLNPAQAVEIARVLDDPGVWRFKVDARLADLAREGCRLQIDGSVSASPVEPEQRIDLGEIHASQLVSVDGEEPAIWPAPSPLALGVRYRWTVVPPRVPAQSDEDPLVTTWRTLDEAWSMRLTKLKGSIDALVEHRARLASSSPRLAGPALGFQREEGALRSRLATLEGWQPSEAGAADTRRLVDELDSLEIDARRIRDEMTKAELEARDAAAREEQEAAWRSQVELARRQLTERRAALDAAKERRMSQLAEQKDIEDAGRTADKIGKKDLQVANAKLRDELERTESSIRHLQHEIEVLTRQERAPFIFRASRPPTASPGKPKARFVPAANGRPNSTTVPEQSMPEVGRLRTAGGQRYLVIDRWEDLERGQQAANRLGARLVAPEET